MLASTTLAYSQEDTRTNNENLDDTLVYVPQYLMESLMSDLDKCDLDRIALNKAKAELALLYVDLAKKDAALNSLKKDLAQTREYNDTLTSQNLQLAMDYEKTTEKLKKGRNWWRVGTFAGILRAIGIHYNWKESWIDVK